MGALRYEPVREIDEPYDEIILDDLAKSSEAILEGKSEAMFDRVGEQRVHMHSVAGLVHTDFAKMAKVSRQSQESIAKVLKN